MRNFNAIPLLIGVFLIVLGASFFAEEIFQIDIPVFRLSVGFGFIIVGMHIITRKSRHNFTPDEAKVVFEDRPFDAQFVRPSYSVVFGSSLADFSNLPAGENKVVEVKCVFGEFRVKINPKANVQILSKAAFGSIEFPDTSTYSFGDHMWRSSYFDPSQPTLTIRAEVVFGSIKVASYL
ncbi:MAG: LiaF-related protein [Bacteroidota bacterium]|nr:LiaF-related protein [Bacteroidota bacterium]